MRNRFQPPLSIRSLPLWAVGTTLPSPGAKDQIRSPGAKHIPSLNTEPMSHIVVSNVLFNLKLT